MVESKKKGRSDLVNPLRSGHGPGSSLGRSLAPRGLAPKSLASKNLALRCLVLCGLLLGGLSLSGCSGMQPQGTSVYREGLVTEDGQPGYITVQHCLIGFKGSVQGKSISRSQAEAEALAQELFAKAQAGEDFSKIVVAHTDDSAPGIYRMANNGFPGDTTSRIPSKHVMPRSQMVAAFGDVGFELDTGQVGLAPYDPVSSPFGWHIIKRLK